MSEFTNSKTTEEYGALVGNLVGHKDETYCVTTAIAYTNGNPHIGHAYESISTDVLARLHRVLGYDTFFLTGTDEHGQKVAASAEKGGLSPKAHCDGYVDLFQDLYKKLLISYDRFIRTTDPHHELTSQKLWQKCFDVGDIFLDQYTGWYTEREELFVTQVEAEATDFKDPMSGVPLKQVAEESYFFRMSKYAEKLIAYIEENPSFIEPETHRNVILGRLRKEGLKDLSISRTSFSWGIPVPEGQQFD
jgi:methionyl-tRNA synthetase